MKLILIRHGAVDYKEVVSRGFIGQGIDLAKLSPVGIKQAEDLSYDTRLAGAQVIFSSPYTRTLQTAAILSKNTGIPIKILTDLCEWIPDLLFQLKAKDRESALQELKLFHGEHTNECIYHWESLSALGKRAFTCLFPYVDQLEKAIVVTHAMVIQQFVFGSIENCGIVETEFTLDSKWNGYINK